MERQTTIVTDDGTEVVNDAGTYKFADGELNLKGKAVANVTRKVTVIGPGKMEIELKEVATTATFTKVK